VPTMPTQPAFATGVVPNAAALNLISQGIDQLAQITIGKNAASGATARPTLKAVRLNPLTIHTGVMTTVPWESTEINTDGMWNPPAGDTITIATPGWYRIAGGISYDPGSGGLRVCRLFVNGTADPGNGTADSDVVLGTGVTNSCRVAVTAYEHLDAGATLHLGAFQNTGADVVIDPQAKWGTWLAVRWDAPY
jgi:hypothetical protein